MPNSVQKSCSYPGCPTLVRHGYCDAHRRAEVTYHDPASQRLYNTSRWHQLRRMQLARQPWCEACLMVDIYTPATDVDHKQRHEGDPVKFFGGTLQSFCHACHSAKTAKEVFVFGHGRGG